MSERAKLTIPHAANLHVMGASVQFNKVYLPLLGSSAVVSIEARWINAIRYAAHSEGVGSREIALPLTNRHPPTRTGEDKPSPI